MSLACPSHVCGIDKALLNINVTANLTAQLLTQVSECIQCPLLFQRLIQPFSNETLIVNTTYPTLFTVLRAGDGDVVCKRQEYHFGEWGEYSMEIDENTTVSNNCKIETVNEPVNNNLYIVIALLIFAGFLLVWCTAKAVRRRLRRGNERDERLIISPFTASPDRTIAAQIWSFPDVYVMDSRERLLSLDVFRGICIVVMIFVNYDGGKYWYFEHSKWNGLTVADVVFPWFMWIMGTSIALSLRSQLNRVQPKKKIFLKILRRSLILFFLGLVLNSKYGLGEDLESMRIFGVLQRFAVTYFVVASMHLASESPGDGYEGLEFEQWASLRDVFPYWPQWLFVIALAVTHTLVTFKLGVPDCPTGYLGPGGLHLNESFPNCTGGAAGYIDRLLLSDEHLYKSASFKAIYQTTVPYDPEGLLGYLTSVVAVFLGLQAGKVLVMFPVYRSRVKRWIFWSAVTGICGGILCEFSINDGWIPINKNLWSLSFVLVTSSMAFLALTLCYLSADVYRLWSGAPLCYVGTNAIVLYVGSTVFDCYFPFNFPVPDTHLAQLLLDVWGTSLWIGVAYGLYYLNFFLII